MNLSWLSVVMGLFFCFGLPSVSWAQQKPAMHLQLDWTELPDYHPKNELIYRRYSVFSDGSMKNLMNFVCPKETKRPLHLMLKWPTDVHPKDFKDEWLESVPVSILINNTTAFKAIGEYIRGELFIDRTEESKDVFDQLVVSKEIVVRLRGYEFRYEASDNMSGLLKDWWAASPESRKIKRQFISYNSALRRCLSKRGGK